MFILKTIVGTGILLSVFSFQLLSAQAPLVEEKYTPRELEPKELVHQFAQKYNVSEKEMSAIISCESGWDVNNHYVSPRENSWGLVQINLLAWTDVTKEEATDSRFAIEFMSKHLKQGDHEMWYTCYHKYLKTS